MIILTTLSIILIIFLSVIFMAVSVSKSYDWNDFSVSDAIAMHESPTVFSRLILDMNPHPYQIELLENKSRRIIVVWGRQLGKTWTLAVRAIWFCVTRVNKRVVILAPSKKQAKIMYREIQKIIKSNEWLQEICIKNIQSEIAFATGCSIINHTVGKKNAESLKGESIDLLLIDEFELLEDPKQTWSNVQPCVSSTHGQIIIISTPITTKGLFYQFFLIAKGVRNKITRDYFKRIPEDRKIGWDLSNKNLLEELQLEFGLPSTYGLYFIRKDTNKPQIDIDALWEARVEFDEIRFKQEYLAMFLDEEISYWSKIDMLNSKRYKYEYSDSDYDGAQALGVDWGGKEDSTAMVIVKKEKIDGVMTDNYALRVLNRWEFRPEDYPEDECNHKAEVSFIKEYIFQRFNISFIFSDMGGVGYEPTKQLQTWGNEVSIEVIPISFNSVGKRQMYNRIKTLMQQGRFLMAPYDDDLQDSFMNIRYKFSDLNKAISFFVPKGFHDDLADACAGACCIKEYNTSKTTITTTQKKIYRNRINDGREYNPYEQKHVSVSVARPRRGKRSKGKRGIGINDRKIYW